MLQTNRLELHPLTPDQLDLWINNLPQLEQELTCQYQAEPMEGFFLDIVKEQARITQSDPENYCFHSFWFLIRNTDRVVIGSADFKDVPDKEGTVEIGYGLGKNFEHQGYMTETVQAMCQWAFKFETISRIIAETEKDGFASQQLLKRCNFVKYLDNETTWWELKKE